MPPRTRSNASWPAGSSGCCPTSRTSSRPGAADRRRADGRRRRCPSSPPMPAATPKRLPQRPCRRGGGRRVVLRAAPPAVTTRGRRHRRPSWPTSSCGSCAAGSSGASPMPKATRPSSANASEPAIANGRRQRIADTARHFVLAAFTRGMFDAAPGATVFRWIVDDGGTPCPDAEDNALQGDVAKGESVPDRRHLPAGAPGLSLPDRPRRGGRHFAVLTARSCVDAIAARHRPGYCAENASCACRPVDSSAPVGSALMRPQADLPRRPRRPPSPGPRAGDPDRRRRSGSSC